MFDKDPGRFNGFSVGLDDLLLDYSKCRVSVETMSLLLALAHATNLEGQRDAMFRGEKINSTEGRAVLHTALRDRSGRALLVDGRDLAADVRGQLAKLFAFADGVRRGTISAHDGRAFTDVVAIGIGGSNLGPAMATAALAPFHDGPRVHFVSNVDGAHLSDTLAGLDPARTMFIVASKTFTTIETMTNARSARAWLATALSEAAVGAHFAAVSTALGNVAQFGIAANHTFAFWDWVGGRYSVWSAIGLPLVIAIGPANFERFLDGAHAMDEHFRTAVPEHNLPMLLGLLGVWHRAVCGYATRAVLPYDQRLASFPAYLQQLEMESNGKRVDRDGHPVLRPTGAVVWGAAGTDAQHSFFQYLHQGTDIVPCEFMIAARSHEAGLAHHHRLLIVNCLAQSEALALGRTQAEAHTALVAEGKSSVEATRLAPHKTFPGNRPSITLAYDQLDPFTLGRLMALHEHRVLVEGAIHGINSFDQWGVELGKELARELEPLVAGATSAAARNASTRGLLAHLRRGQP